MFKGSLVIILALSFVSCHSFASTQYRGMISAKIVEKNGHVYGGYVGLEDEGVFEDSQVIYFYQDRGQKVALTKKNLLIDSSNAHKYHLVLNIVERVNDNYKAELIFFHNSMVYDDETQDYVLVSKEIKKALVDGILNTESNFKFIDDEKPNFIVSIDIDRIFDKEEILAKLKKKLANQTK
ncbi:hypothetical protein [Aliikangiella sp. IMCC44632]